MTEHPSHAVGAHIHYRGIPAMTGIVAQAELLPNTYGLYAVVWDDEPWRLAAWYSYFDLEPIHE